MEVMIKKEDLVHGKQYKVTHENGSSAHAYWNGSLCFMLWDDLTQYACDYRDVVNIEEIEPKTDTLQEFTNWLKENKHGCILIEHNRVLVGGVNVVNEFGTEFENIEQALKGIRKPEYEEGAIYHVNEKYYLKFERNNFYYGTGELMTEDVKTAVKVS